MRSMIIFGGTKGIGRILAEHYHKNGINVSIAGRHLKSAAKRDKIKSIKADVSSEKDVERVFEVHLKAWGSDPDVVINCAAIQGPIGNSWEIPVKEFERTLRINLLGGFIVSRAAIKRMIPAKEGSIIMFSGGGAACGRPYFNAYGTSKTGVLRMVEGMAEELKEAGYPQIIINAIAPGAFKTGMMTEILKAGKRAGKKALDEAAHTIKVGSTPVQKIIDLVDFFIDRRMNKGLTGRLIHVREDYHKLLKEYGKGLPEEIGKLRRIPVK